MKQVIFVGWVNKGKAPVEGETTKNQYIIAGLQKHCRVTVLDFYQKRRHPWIYLQALWALVTMPKASIVFSTSVKNVYAVLRLFKRLRLRRHIVYWGIGGVFSRRVLEGRFHADVFNYVTHNLVQSRRMVDELRKAGVSNSLYVPNFKAIPYFPDFAQAITKRRESPSIRFVFLSRIMPQKGCDNLLEAIRQMNAKGLEDRFIVDFYGKVDPTYGQVFMAGIEELPNAIYHGLLDLRTKEGYDMLATYHAMLFPTYWVGEGFAGVFIDAFISGLPVLASDWAYNSEVITDGKQGLIYPVHNVEALANVMEKCILGQVDLLSMAKNARDEATKYETENVLSVDFLKRIGLI